jgi:CelD/BcsL family acetyltransferase involved in cellulose biosynthesis
VQTTASASPMGEQYGERAEPSVGPVIRGTIAGERPAREPDEEATSREAGRVHIEVVTDPARLAALAPEWNALAARHGEGLPFRTWEWVDAWLRWFPERRLAVRDEPEVLIFRAPDGAMVGVAPLVRTRRPGLGPAILRGLEFLGADPNITEVRGVLVDPAWEGDVYRGLLAHLAGEKGHQWIGWRGVAEGGKAEALLRADRAVPLTAGREAYRLRLPGTWEEFKSARPRNLKESLRRCYNSLKRDGHLHALEVARTPDEVDAAVERFLALHASRARADGFKEHGDVFDSDAARGFLRDVCRSLAARDAVRVFQLRIGDRIVASRIGFLVGETVYLYFSGFDPEWGRYSVMTTTVAEAIQWAIGAGLSWVHLSTGTDESKLRWRPERIGYLEGVQFAPDASRLARWARSRSPGEATHPLLVPLRWLLGRRRSATAPAEPTLSAGD